MSYDTFRSNDMRRERILAEYLDIKLYGQEIFENVRRTNEIEDQLKGSDIVLSIPIKEVFNAIIDEKAQLYYLDGGLPTFAFELNFVNKNGERVEGWLTDESKSTTFYQLLFLTAEKDFESVKKKEKVEYILIKKEEILKFIALDLAILRRKGIEVSKSEDFRQFREQSIPYYFTHSTQLAESPVNIIIRKNKLIELSFLHGNV